MFAYGMSSSGVEHLSPMFPSMKRGRMSLGRGGLLDPDYFALGVEVHDVADGLALLLDCVEDDVATVGGALIADAVDLAVLMTALLHAGHELVLGGVAHAWTKAGVRGVGRLIVSAGHGGHGGVGAVAIRDARHRVAELIDAQGANDDEGAEPGQPVAPDRYAGASGNSRQNERQSH